MNNSNYFQHGIRTQIHSGPGSLALTPSLADGMGSRRLILISDKGLEQAGLVQRCFDAFNYCHSGNAKIAAVFTDISQDASCDSINTATDFAREKAIDGIIALGGGSVIDASKGVKYALQHGFKDLSSVMNTGFKMKPWPQASYSGIPHIAIPTTAGTGAEVSPIAVFFNSRLRVKCNLIAAFLDPDMAILDPQLTTGLPPQLTATTGMDALTHAIEALASPNANSFTDAYALQSVALIREQLPKAVANGKDINARMLLLQASSMAISAFCGSLNAIPVHNCAHAFGSLLHIPHGDANAVLLPVVMKVENMFYRRSADKLAAAMGIAKASNPVATVDAVAATLSEFCENIAAPSDFRRWGIEGQDIDELCSAVQNDPASLFYRLERRSIETIVDRVS